MNENKKYIIPSDTQLVPDIVGRILMDLKSYYTFILHDDCLFKIKVVLNELIANAIIHGNKNAIEKKVNIELEAGDQSIKFFIKDQGKCFSNDNRKEYDLEDECNRGIMICSDMCDELDFYYHKGKGNIVTVIFKHKKYRQKHA